MTVVTVDPLEQLLTQQPPGCEATVQKGKPCPEVAEWRVIFRPCCRSPITLLCTRCLDELGKLPGITCRYCKMCFMPGASAILSAHPI